MYAHMSPDEAYDRDEVSLAQIEEDESWSDFYDQLEWEAERQAEEAREMEEAWMFEEHDY